MLLKFADEATVCEKLNHLGSLDAVSNSEDSQACTLYAHNMYDTNRVIEVCVGIVKLSSSSQRNFLIYAILRKNKAFFSSLWIWLWHTFAKLLKCLILQLDQRPSADYMEKLQKYISPIMRGILIDWLVEVSNLVVTNSLWKTKFYPDTWLKYMLSFFFLNILATPRMVL